MAALDAAYKKFVELVKEISPQIDKIENESETRFKIIDRILIEVLGWKREEIVTEKRSNEGYIDYLISHAGRNRLVVEAKRTSIKLINTSNVKMAAYKLGGAALKSASDGVLQATNYCLSTGVNFAALTSGCSWIGFQAYRTDGKPPRDGQAIVFPNLSSIGDEFAVFYDLFSVEGVLNKNNLVQLHRFDGDGDGISYAGALVSAVPDDRIRLIEKTPLSADLERVFERFFSTISGHDDPEMLINCFVETKESKDADVTLDKITRDLINYVETLATRSGEELAREIEGAVQAKRSESVLIIGNKGAGKSTFIDRFFRLFLERGIRDKCLVLRIDMADATGDMATVQSWITEKLLACIEANLYPKGTPDFDELQGIFFKEYQRWSEGEMKHLYTTDHDKFKIEFGRYMLDEVKRDKYTYTLRLLRHAIRSRRMMPCLVFDNTDQFPQPFQEAVFQYAQAILRAVLSFIIIPITDRTLWQLSKAGPFQSYKAKTFYLPVPSTRSILERRIEFIKLKSKEDSRDRQEYFLSKGIRLSIENIVAFAVCVEEIFLKTEFVARRIGWLANHDIRRSLEIAQRVMTSPAIKIEDLVKTYLAKRVVSIPPYKVTLGLILGQYNFFSRNENSFVADLFSINSSHLTTPLLKVSILQLLSDKAHNVEYPADSYLSVETIEAYFEPARVAARSVDGALSELIKSRLVEPYDPSDDRIYSNQKVSISYSGRMHIEMALHDPIFIGQMALRTSIRSADVSGRIGRLHLARQHDQDAWNRVAEEFVSYLLEEDSVFAAFPKMESYCGQQNLRQELSGRWVTQRNLGVK